MTPAASASNVSRRARVRGRRRGDVRLRTGIRAAKDVNTQVAGRQLAALVDLNRAFADRSAVRDFARAVLGIGHHATVIAREQVQAATVGRVGQTQQGLACALQIHRQGLAIAVGQHATGLHHAGSCWPSGGSTRTSN
ncbi:hypothetical protein G6F65_021872 [Rhizopus arrhizus]|nr:hypothetical protein G6F65_021872 [Rhizopus arrhizus]